MLDRWGGGRTSCTARSPNAGYVVASVDNRGTPAPKGATWRKAVYGRSAISSSKDQAAAVARADRAAPYLDPDAGRRLGLERRRLDDAQRDVPLSRPLSRSACRWRRCPTSGSTTRSTRSATWACRRTTRTATSVGSPITFADGLKGNLLLVHGSGDDNVHYQGTERLVNRLVALGKPFDLMVYPNRTHASRGRGHDAAPVLAARALPRGARVVIDRTHRGSVALLRMAHGKANALDVEFCEAHRRALDELARRADARRVVLTGQGRMFSAGVDLVRLLKAAPTTCARFLPALHRLFDAVFFFPKPVVAAVNGHAIAGGCVLECCADYRMMAQGGGRIGIPELLVGVPFPSCRSRSCGSPRRSTAVAGYRGTTLTADVALARPGRRGRRSGPGARRSHRDGGVAGRDPGRRLCADEAPDAGPGTQRIHAGADHRRQNCRGFVGVERHRSAAIRDYVAKTLKRKHSLEFTNSPIHQFLTS